MQLNREQNSNEKDICHSHRPKQHTREKTSVSNMSNPSVRATSRIVGMMDIIDYISKASGADDAAYASTDQATARKILSIIRYLFTTNEQIFPNIMT